jgi:hypothetical protein
MGEKRVFQHYITLYQLVLKSFHDMFVETEQQQHSVDIQSLLVDAFALANKHILNYLHAVFVPMAAKSTEEDIVALRQELLTNHTTTTTSATATVQTPSEEGRQSTKVSSAAEEVKAIDT